MQSLTLKRFQNYGWGVQVVNIRVVGNGDEGKGAYKSVRKFQISGNSTTSSILRR
jgi:hypothetical protein